MIPPLANPVGAGEGSSDATRQPAFPNAPRAAPHGAARRADDVGAIATMLQTNPVVVRRTMAGLRDAGYVRSEKGHGGGWVLACRSRCDVSLLDVHRAVGGPQIFAIGNEHAGPDACLVEQVVNAAIEDALSEAEALLIARFGAVNLAELAARFRCALNRRPLPSSP
jgi:DNA-binding IscR family transcriptional regulator